MLRATEREVAAASSDRLSLLEALPTPATYRTCLVQIYGFDAPVEAALARTSGLGELVDLRGRDRIDRLRSDLRVLGVTDFAEVPICYPLPVLGSCGEALGWWFGLEHATLIYGQLHRHAQRYLPDQVAIAGSYLAEVASTIGKRLGQLGAVLERLPHEMIAQLVGAARLALRRQHRWFAPGHATVGSLGPPASAVGGDRDGRRAGNHREPQEHVRPVRAAVDGGR